MSPSIAAAAAMSGSADHSAASLYCAEDPSDVVSSACNSDPQPFRHFSPPDESTINRLIDCEPHHVPHPDYLRRFRDRPIDLTARQDSINWILKANGWQFQLLAVASLSLAAKMEEPYVPLILDLQLFEPKFVFEPKTVQRMELWVMAILDWRLLSVTPFDYIDYFVSKLHCSVSVLRSSSDLILNTIRVIDFLGFPPSTIAAAAVLSAAGDSVDVPETFYERANKEMVRSCHQLMEEYLVDTCPSAGHKDWVSEPPPPSPVGVLDAAACVSCDTHSEIPSSGSAFGSGSIQSEPQNRRPRLPASDV
ncbi:hypothetical protein U1Q18_035188 [Sarracenia purpurea var. burkii]